MNSHQLFPPRIAALFVGFILIASPLAAQSVPGKTTVTGTYLGNGKDGNIQYLTVLTREPFNDKAAIQLIFTEKNPSKSEKPDFDASFQKLGSALVLSVFEDGGIFGCEVSHAAHSKQGFSSIGSIKVEDMKVTDTTVSGHVTTGGEQDAFGEKWNVDLTFSAPLPKGAFAAVKVEAPKEEEEKEKVPAGPAMAVGKLPLPSSAKSIEYKQTVEHILLGCDASVSTVAAELSKKLKAQGWKDSGGGLTTKTNAILKQELNGAELTIMVRGAGKGCTVQVFTEGLDWSETPESTAAATPAPGRAPTDPQAEADRLLKEAMKQIPGGF